MAFHLALANGLEFFPAFKDQLVFVRGQRWLLFRHGVRRE